MSNAKTTYALLGGATLVAIRDGAVVPRPVLIAGEPCPGCGRKAAHAAGCPVVVR